MVSYGKFKGRDISDIGLSFAGRNAFLPGSEEGSEGLTLLLHQASELPRAGEKKKLWNPDQGKRQDQ